MRSSILSGCQCFMHHQSTSCHCEGKFQPANLARVFAICSRDSRASGSFGYHSKTCHSPSVILSSTKTPAFRILAAKQTLSLSNKSRVAEVMIVAGKEGGMVANKGEMSGKDADRSPETEKDEKLWVGCNQVPLPS